MTTPDDSILNGISIGHPSDVLDLDAEGNSIWRRPLVKYAITRHEISGCVTRAGLDVATEEFGGGVIGYTVGDIRKAYGGYIPDWVRRAVDIRGDESDDMNVWL